MAGTRVGTGSLTVDGAGNAANASLSLSNVSLGKGEFQVNNTTTFNQSDPRIGIDNSGNFAIVWRDTNRPGIYARRYNAAGENQGNEFLVNTHSSRIREVPDIAMNGAGNFALVWQSLNQDGSDYGIYARLYNAAGEAQGSEFLVNTTTLNAQKNPSVAMDNNGNFVVVWQSLDQDGSNNGIYAQRYNAAGVADQWPMDNLFWFGRAGMLLVVGLWANALVRRATHFKLGQLWQWPCCLEQCCCPGWLQGAAPRAGCQSAPQRGPRPRPLRRPRLWQF